MITKELYKECVQSIIDFDEKDLELYNATNGILDMANYEEIHQLENKFIKLLEYCTKDTCTGDWGSDLQYFLYELDNGKEYSPGSITDKDGNDIKCANIDDLWNNFIIANHPEIEEKVIIEK